MRIPTDREIRALHAKYAPTQEAFDLVYTHCEIVCGIAEQLLDRNNLNINADLVRAGSLLHDIGVYRLYGDDGHLDQAGYVRHGILGYELLAGEGLTEAVSRFCSCHTGVGISRDDILKQSLPLPPADYLAETIEEELVMYADKFHSKTRPPTFVSAETYASHIRRFGEDKVRRFNSMIGSFGIPDVESLIGGTAVT
ncbi:phosphohydrolase [Planotetraspora thailandica]|uniref:Phosphohydrolase n=1 Tax=Planotetraspora thailandica TaxID=487172 RepID=A0A8J3XU62_9ACTN|nr:HD domain-containing protein [Planotetraspora thailandica]GII55087.1 phosphohydrolase [Planotetraspora thailandica]